MDSATFFKVLHWLGWGLVFFCYLTQRHALMHVSNKQSAFNIGSGNSTVQTTHVAVHAQGAAPGDSPLSKIGNTVGIIGFGITLLQLFKVIPGP